MIPGLLAKIHTGGLSSLDGSYCMIIAVDPFSFCDSICRVVTHDGEFRWYNPKDLRVVKA